ncbi:MAG: hypothetical protein DRP47_10180 [Candidatus Zixiibacteriota bacterium]|nr:MAG: hypothetical protein DRP47_10180 [candidate division Zixibacteria bacterium]
MLSSLNHLLLIVSIILLINATHASAENLYQLQQQSMQLSNEAKSSYEHLQTLGQINRLGLQRIRQAMTKIKAARSGNERSYYRMSYVDERAKHIKAYAIYLIKLIRDQQQYEAQSEKFHHLYCAYQNSEQIRGLQTLFGMVLQLEKQLLDSCRGISSLNTSVLQQQVELLVIGNMLAMSGARDQKHLSDVSNLHHSVYRGLAGLKEELHYLDQQLEKIPIREG